ncbi:MAG: DNA replication/repair protein RecF, partial [Peptococcia bacterium]
ILQKYRNYEFLDQIFKAQVNILIGLNAQGKTNLLEAVYYLTGGKTYRAARDQQLKNWDAPYFIVKGILQNKLGQKEIEIRYREDRPSSKEIRINGVTIRKTSELFGQLTAVLFAPEDLSMIKGAPAERRRLLDYDISQVSPIYYSKLQKHNRLLNQRNHLLKRHWEKRRQLAELEVWNEQYLQACVDIVNKRVQALEKLAPLARLMQRRLTAGQESIEIKYMLCRKYEVKKVEEIRELLIKEMNSMEEEEIRRGLPLWGPPRDDLNILVNGTDLKLFGSQGQHRTAVLAIKLAELEFFKAETGEYPILLLDDVLSELDQKRREQLIDTIRDRNIQCFITTTEDLEFNKDEQTTVQKYYIRQGTIKEMECES